MTKSRKLQKNCIFFRKYLVISKKSSTFARFFVPHVSLRTRKGTESNGTNNQN